MFDNRHVPDGHFAVGEPVWVIYQGRVQMACVSSVPTQHPFSRVLTVVLVDRPGNRAVEICDVFKRPTEHHLLKAAVDDLVEDLQKDCRELLAALT